MANRYGPRPQGAMETEMNVTAAATMKLIKAARASGLPNEVAVLSVIIGALSVIRVDGLNEEGILREARKAVPQSVERLATA